MSMHNLKDPKMTKVFKPLYRKQCCVTEIPCQGHPTPHQNAQLVHLMLPVHSGSTWVVTDRPDGQGFESLKANSLS